MPSVRVIFAIVATALLLTACGQKGPLYLPKPDSQLLTTVQN